MTSPTQNTAVFPQVDGGSATGGLAPHMEPVAHFSPLDLDDERLASLRRMVANMGAQELRLEALEGRIDGHFERGRYANLYRHVARRRLAIRINKGFTLVLLGCLAFWGLVAIAFAEPERLTPPSGPGFEICQQKGC